MTQSPQEFIDSARLASDPVKHMGSLRVREALRRWLESGAGHECRLTIRRAQGSTETFWCADLLDAHTCVASAMSHDADDALANALAVAGAA